MTIGNIIFAHLRQTLDNSYMDIGDLIAKNLELLIERKGANPSAVAKAAGMGHTGVRDIITRKAKEPKYATLLKIAEVLEVDIHEITVGPGASSISQEDREILHLLSQLSDEERGFLLRAARGAIAQS